MKYFFILFISFLSILAFGNEQRSVYIIEPLDNAVLKSPVIIKFGLSGMGVAPAGVDRKNTGHHHLLLDLRSPFVSSNVVTFLGVRKRCNLCVCVCVCSRE